MKVDLIHVQIWIILSAKLQYNCRTDKLEIDLFSSQSAYEKIARCVIQETNYPIAEIITNINISPNATSYIIPNPTIQ